MKTPALTLTLATLLAAGWIQAGTMTGMQMSGMPTPPSANAGISPAVRALSISQAWLAAAPPGAQELSAYLVLGNPGTQSLTLSGASTPVAGQMMLMKTGKDAAGRTTMQMVSTLRIPAGGALKILPGQAHLMLQKLKRQPQPGETVALTLKFSDGSARTVQLMVKKW